MPTFRRYPDFWFCFFLGILVLGVSLPFLNHAYHIYEPLFLKMAQQIQNRPLDPYGFMYLWGNDYQPIYNILSSPPLFSYYLALVIQENPYPPEWLVHLSLVPFSILALFSFYVFIRQLNLSPLLAFLGSLFFLVSPIFFIYSNLAVPDMATVAIMMFALVLAIEAWSKGRLYLLFLSGLLLGVACCMRYNALLMLGISFLLGLTYTDRKKASIPACIALLITFAWILFYLKTYRNDYIFSILAFHFDFSLLLQHFWSTNIYLSLVTFIPFFLLPFVFKRSPFWFFLTLFFAGGFGLLFARSGRIPNYAFLPDAIFFSLGLTSLLVFLMMALKKIKITSVISWKIQKDVHEWKSNLIWNSSSDPEQKNFRELILFFWFASSIFLPFYFVLFPSQYFLMALPPFIILFLYWLDSQSKKYSFFLLMIVPFLAIISFIVTKSDFAMANAFREQAKDIAKGKWGNKRIWFTGHWGWQYYMEKFGFFPLPSRWTVAEGVVIPGDIVVTSEVSSPQLIHPLLRKHLQVISSFNLNSDLPFRTMNSKSRAGFYSGTWGPLPFNLSSDRMDHITFYRMIEQGIGD